MAIADQDELERLRDAWIAALTRTEPRATDEECNAIRAKMREIAQKLQRFEQDC